MTLEIPDRLTLPDGTTAAVRTVTATVTDGHVDRVVYTVEKDSGAWLDVPADVIAAHATTDDTTTDDVTT